MASSSLLIRRVKGCQLSTLRMLQRHQSCRYRNCIHSYFQFSTLRFFSDTNTFATQSSLAYSNFLSSKRTKNYDDTYTNTLIKRYYGGSNSQSSDAASIEKEGSMRDNVSSRELNPLHKLPNDDELQPQGGEKSVGRSGTNRRKLSLYEMDAWSIRDIDSFEDLADLVKQVEAMTTLTGDDIGPLFLPLMRMTCMPEHGRAGAELTERLLFYCLGRLPPSLDQRFGAENQALPFPDCSMYNRTIIAWGNTRSPEGAAKAERIFQLMMSEHLQEMRWLEQQPQLSKDGAKHSQQEQTIRSPHPDRRCYKSLLRAWAVSGAPNGPSKAMEVLREMERISGVSRLLEQEETSSSKEQEVMARVPMTDRERIKTTPSRGFFRRPDAKVYNSVMSAYAKTFVLKEAHALNRVKSLMNRMDRLKEVTGDEEYTLDWISYHSVLRAYSKYAAYSPGGLDPSFVKDVESLLERIQKEDKDALSKGTRPIYADLSLPWAYGVAVEALIKTNPQVKSLERAEDILFSLVQKENDVIFTSAEKRKYASWGKKAIDFWPEQDTIMKLVIAWERSGVSDSDERVQRLLRLAVQTPFSRIYFLNEAMEKWLQSGWKHAPELLETMLERQLDGRTSRFKPTGRTFAITIKAWLRSRKVIAPHRAELVFQRLTQLYEDGVRNDRQWFEVHDSNLVHVMTAWFNRCGEGQRYHGLAGNRYPAEHIESLLMWFRGADWIENISGHYAMAIRAWAKQVIKDENADEELNPVQRSYELLNLLEEDTSSIPAYPCNWVLEACCRKQATVEQKLEAFEVATETFRRGRRNARTYVLMVQVLTTQVIEMDDSHLKTIEDLFQECCSRGMLTQEMVWAVAGVVPATSLQRLLGVSYQYANTIVQVRTDGLKRDDGGGGHGQRRLRWNGRPPNALLVENLPRDWSVNGLKGARRQQGDWHKGATTNSHRAAKAIF